MPSTKVGRHTSKRPITSRGARAKTRAEVLSSKTVFRGRVFSVTSERVREPGGFVVQRDIVRHGGSVVVLAVDDSGPEPHILLESQYRHAAGKYLWELPAGGLAHGELPIAGAKRELLEETGYRARHWSRILHFYPSPGFLDETMTIYLARGLTAGPACPEEDERITWVLAPLSQALEMIRSGRICDAKTIAGVLWLAQFLGHRRARS